MRQKEQSSTRGQAGQARGLRVQEELGQQGWRRGLSCFHSLLDPAHQGGLSGPVAPVQTREEQILKSLLGDQWAQTALPCPTCTPPPPEPACRPLGIPKAGLQAPKAELDACFQGSLHVPALPSSGPRGQTGRAQSGPSHTRPGPAREALGVQTAGLGVQAALPRGSSQAQASPNPARTWVASSCPGVATGTRLFSFPPGRQAAASGKRVCYVAPGNTI